MSIQNKSNVVLVNPNATGNYVQGTFLREHIGLGYLSAELRLIGFNPTMIDSRMMTQTPEQAAKEILLCNPIMVGFSIIAKDATPWTEQTIKHIKKELPDVHIVLGNYFPSLQPERTFTSVPSADSIVMREGDITLPELAQTIASGKEWRKIKGIAYKTIKNEVIINPRRNLVTDFNSLPFPDHTAGKYGLKEWAIEGSRGCYMRCTFCSIGPFFDLGGGNIRWRTRSSESIVSEMLLNMDLHPEITTWRFVDPDFVGAESQQHIDRLRDFSKETLRLNGRANYIIDTRTKVVNSIPEDVWVDLKRGGLSEVYIGIETSTDKIKAMMAKGTTIEEDRMAIQKMNKVGIRVRYGYMMITPWTTEDDIEENARVLHSLGFPRLDKYFQELYVVPGTKSVELAKSVTNIWFDNNGEGEYYSYGLPEAINNLRKLSRALVTTQGKFLSHYQTVHENIRKSLEDTTEDVSLFKNALGDLSLEFFMEVYKKAKLLEKNVSDTTIGKTSTLLVEKYLAKLIQIENNYNNRNRKSNNE